MSDSEESSLSKSPERIQQNDLLDPIHQAKMFKDIIVILVKKDNQEIREIIQNVDIRPYLNEDQQLILSRLTERLKNRYGFCLQYCQLAFYIHPGQIFMSCGTDPISQDIVLSQKQYLDDKQIILRARDFPISLIHKLMSEQINQKAVNQRDQEEGNQLNKCRRTKERRIGYIIDKVVKWRQYYTGIKEDGELKRYSLEESASKVGISKKSLDDYLLQIRFGRKYGFNFNEHKNDKVGVLRDYVRKNKKIMVKPEGAVKGKKRKGKNDEEGEEEI